MDLGVARRKADCLVVEAGVATVTWAKGISHDFLAVPATSEAGLIYLLHHRQVFSSVGLTGVAPRTERVRPHQGLTRILF